MFGSKKRAVRARIAQAALPAEVSRFIAEVVRRTRLRRAEQVDVAGELVSHFAEGLAAGRAERDLIAAYGDPKSSARELRRSTIAKRHVVDRAIGGAFRWSAIAVAGAGALYIGYATVLHFRQPVISFDGAAVVNAGMPKPGREGRAFDLYLERLSTADGKCVLVHENGDYKARLRIEETLPFIGFDPDALSTVRADLESMRTVVDALRDMRGRPVFGLRVEPDVWSDPRLKTYFEISGKVFPDSAPVLSGALIGSLLPHLAAVRAGAKLMCADAAIAAHDGRADDFVADIEAAWAMAGHSGETGFLISVLVEYGTRDLVLKTIVSAIENHGEMLTDAQLSRLDELVRQADPVASLVRGIESERASMYDLVQRCYSDDGNGDGVLLFHAYEQLLRGLEGFNSVRDDETQRALRQALGFLGGPAAAAAMPGRRKVLAEYDAHIDRLMAAARSPVRSESMAAARACDEQIDPRGRNGLVRTIVDAVAPGIGRAIGHSWKMRCSVEGALAAIGIERFRRANGRFPAAHAELNGFVGRELGASSDARVPWKYALVDGRPLIYDCGLDGLDDRARTPLEPRSLDEGATAIRPRTVSLSGCGADGAFHVGAPTQDEGGHTMRVRSIVPADAPLEPSRPLVEAETHGVLATDGDFIRVWWKSRASGAHRVVPAADK
jgi:hypothetical protein